MYVFHKPHFMVIIEAEEMQIRDRARLELSAWLFRNYKLQPWYAILIRAKWSLETGKRVSFPIK